LPKVGLKSNLDQVTKNTSNTPNLPVKGHELDPAEWAGLGACLAGGLSLGGVLGNGATVAGFETLQTLYFGLAGLGIAGTLCAISWSRGPLQSILVPLFLGLAALMLIIPGGGLNSASSVALLWPLLGAAAVGQTLRTGLVISLIIAVCLIILTPVLGTGLQGASAVWAGLCGLSVAACFALASVWRVSRDRAIDNARSTLLAAQASQARDAAQADARAARAEVQERSTFMAEMSHEIRTPLNAILGFADTMREGVFGPLPTPYADYPELIHRSGSHLLELVSDLLDISKIEAGRYQVNLVPVRLDDIAAEAVRLSSGVAGQAKVQLRREASGAVIVQGDPRALRQIALNLLSNAIKFTPEGGRVIIRARLQAGDGKEAQPVLEVQDTGVGMSAESLQKIAIPWSQANNQTTTTARTTRSSGLGLALVKKLAELQNGRLELSSQLGQGTLAKIVFSSAAEKDASPGKITQ
jgi:signal transduction histidine kinase